MDKVKVEEITKWLDMIEPIVDKIEVSDSKAEELYNNMKAYISDCKHFMKEGKLVLSFECIVWAWSIFELCKGLELFEVQER